MVRGDPCVTITGQKGIGKTQVRRCTIMVLFGRILSCCGHCLVSNLVSLLVQYIASLGHRSVYGYNSHGVSLSLPIFRGRYDSPSLRLRLAPRGLDIHHEVEHADGLMQVDLLPLATTALVVHPCFRLDRTVPGSAQGVCLHERAECFRRDLLLSGGQGGPRQQRLQLARGGSTGRAHELFVRLVWCFVSPS